MKGGKRIPWNNLKNATDMIFPNPFTPPDRHLQLVRFRDSWCQRAASEWCNGGEAEGECHLQPSPYGRAKGALG